MLANPTMTTNWKQIKDAVLVIWNSISAWDMLCVNQSFPITSIEERAQKVWINIAAVIIMAFVIDKFLDTY